MYMFDMYVCLCFINLRLKICVVVLIEYMYKIVASIARSGDFVNSFKFDIVRVDFLFVVSSMSVMKCVNIIMKIIYFIVCECMI